LSYLILLLFTSCSYWQRCAVAQTTSIDHLQISLFFALHGYDSEPIDIKFGTAKCTIFSSHFARFCRNWCKVYGLTLKFAIFLSGTGKFLMIPVIEFIFLLVLHRDRKKTAPLNMSE